MATTSASKSEAAFDFENLFREGCVQTAPNLEDARNHFLGIGFEDEEGTLYSPEGHYFVELEGLVNKEEGAWCIVVGWTDDTDGLWEKALSSLKDRWPSLKPRPSDGEQLVISVLDGISLSMRGNIVGKHEDGTLLYGLALVAAQIDAPHGATAKQ